MYPSSGLWGGLGLWFPVYHPESTIVRPAPALKLCERVILFQLLTRAHCAQCSASIPLWLTSQVLAPAGRSTELPDCALGIPVSHDRLRVCLAFLLVHQVFELNVKVAFNNRSAVTQHKIDLLKFSLRSSCWERTNDVFVLLVCFCFLHI